MGTPTHSMARYSSLSCPDRSGPSQSARARCPAVHTREGGLVITRTVPMAPSAAVSVTAQYADTVAAIPAAVRGPMT